MSFKIERGLFKLDFVDQYAILGVSVDAEGGEVRKRYLKIARHLHPDSCKAESEAEKQLANQLLSKLVNPAYEQLHPDKNRAEYKLMLGRLGQRLATETSRLQVQSEAAKQLAKAGGNVDHVYRTLLQELAKSQYESINKALEAIAQISELNSVYLMMKQGDVGGARPTVPLPPPPPLGRGSTGSPAQQPSQTAQNPRERREGPLAEPYLRRAEEYMGKNLFAKAVLELRDALKIEPSNSRCHGLLGIAYLRQNQATMAKVHINKALELNPQDDIALQGKEMLNRLAGQTSSGSGTTTKQPSKTSETPPKQTGGKQPDKPTGGGLFGGIFGGGKKK